MVRVAELLLKFFSRSTKNKEKKKNLESASAAAKS